MLRKNNDQKIPEFREFREFWDLGISFPNPSILVRLG
jgi:hypothetical protein